MQYLNFNLYQQARASRIREEAEGYLLYLPERLAQISEHITEIAPTKERKLALLGMCSTICHAIVRQITPATKLGKSGRFAGFDRQDFLRQVQHGEFSVRFATGGVSGLLKQYWPRGCHAPNTVRLLRRFLEAMGCFTVTDNEQGLGPRQPPAKLIEVNVVRLLEVAYCCEYQLRQESYAWDFLEEELPDHKGYLLAWLWNQLMPHGMKWQRDWTCIPSSTDECWWQFVQLASPVRSPQSKPERSITIPTFAWEFSEEAQKWWNWAAEQFSSIWRIAPDWALPEF